MIPHIDARTRLIALLGDPVEHSFSPVMQNAAFAAAGVPGVYLALRVDADSVAPMLRGIARAGGGGNVTVPHKQSAVAALDRPTPAVLRTGACNCFWAEDGLVHGDNTDVQGFRTAVARLRPGSGPGARVLLVGAGGAARAALAGLEADGAAEVVVLNRTLDRARSLVADFADGSLALRALGDPASIRGESFDLVVNSTTLGLRPGDPLPLEPDAVRAGAALDLVYTAGRTPWVRAMEAAGVPAADGMEMLLQQGAAAFERWWRRPAPVQVMRNALPRRA